KNITLYCHDGKPVLVIFNPADITGLITLIYSGLKPSQVSTLAALDSTRLQHELAKYFNVPSDEVVNCRTYGGHGEQMAVFASTTRVAGEPLSEIVGTERFPDAEWQKMKERVIQGGKHIIDLRGRSSFQSPAYLSIEMIAAAMGGTPFRWPVGTYVNNGRFNHIMMAMETTVTADGVKQVPVKGTPAEEADLEKSYRHLCELRDEVIALGVLPPIDQWHEINPNID
ncbi:MAG: malate dehydrogenase, partial [Muribaculaceae bacterium]|nr:malate dehydrogenase [Muribaculaceae bacterium]